VVQVISVEPFTEGWAVRQDGIENPQIFTSGAKAEDAARRLGASLSRAGAPAEVRIWLRDGALGGRFICVG